MSTEPRTEKEFDEAMKEEMKKNEEFRKVIEAQPERYELYKRKWFDSLEGYKGDVHKWE